MSHMSEKKHTMIWGRAIYLPKVMLTPTPHPNLKKKIKINKKNRVTSWIIILSSGSGLPNNWHKSHKRLGYVNLRSRISSASKPPATVPFGHLYTAGIERASCSTLRSCLLNLSRKVGRFGECEYIPYLCFDDCSSKSLLPKQVDASLLVQTFKVNFKTQLNTRRNFAQSIHKKNFDVLILSVERMKKKHIIGVLSKKRTFVKKNFGYIW